MKGKRVIAGILLVGILAVTFVGCKNTDDSKICQSAVLNLHPLLRL